MRIGRSVAGFCRGIRFQPRRMQNRFALTHEQSWLAANLRGREMVGILRHKIFDHLRRVCRERQTRADYGDTDGARDQEAWDDSVLWVHEVAAESLRPSRRMELAEFRQELEVALGRLPPRIAQVFQLYEVEERPNREVCDRLNISESNLWVMLHRARKQLREDLSDWKNQPPRSKSVAIIA